LLFVDQAQGRTVMELVTADRPGLLWQVGDALGLCRARLQGAKIATYGERVEDLFFLTGDDHRAIDDAVQLECLRVTLTRALGPGR